MSCQDCAIHQDSVNRFQRREAEANARWRAHQEITLVALRMLHRAGKLTPKTDDERALLRSFAHESMTLAPNRRLGHAGVGDKRTRSEYVEETADWLRSFLRDELAGKDTA